MASASPVGTYTGGRAPERSRRARGTASGFHPVAGLFGKQGGGDDPAELACLHEIPGEPGAPRPRFLDKDQVCGLHWQVAKEWITSGLPGADGAEVDTRGVVSFGHRGHGEGVVVNIETDRECARRWHG